MQQILDAFLDFFRRAKPLFGDPHAMNCCLG